MAEQTLQRSNIRNNSSASGVMGAKHGVLKISENIDFGCWKNLLTKIFEHKSGNNKGLEK
jgi:hypothetical protein